MLFFLPKVIIDVWPSYHFGCRPSIISCKSIRVTDMEILVQLEPMHAGETRNLDLIAVFSAAKSSQLLSQWCFMQP